MLKIIEYKIYPNKAQEQKLYSILRNARRLYNTALEHRIKEYKENSKTISYYDQAKKFKGKYNMPASLTQAVLRKLDITYKAFFSRGYGFPRFKNWRRFNCIELRQYKTDGYFDAGKLKLWKMKIKTSNHRELEGKPMQGRIIKRVTGWYWQITCEIEKSEQKEKIQTAIGLDMGLKALVFDSEKNQTKAPKFLRQSEEKLITYHKSVSRKKKGSYNRRKAVDILAKTYLKVKRQRLDFLHKLSRKYADYDLICVEKLNIAGMLKNHKLAKSIADASWNLFLQLLRYKAESAGSYFVEVNPKYTTQKCSQCGTMVKKTLSQRTHICPECSLIIDRDYNASLNILRLGISHAGEIGLPILLKAEAVGID